MNSTGTSAKRRQERFHGAFTGGFSAGFFNSVGSAEGWTPATFTSSREKRAAPREQRPEDFMDDEDGLLTEQLQAKPEYDTLGSTAAELARKHAEHESSGGAIPGPAPSELLIPVGDPMGKKLLETMGWREGQGVGCRVRRREQFTAVAGDESPEKDLADYISTGLGEKAKALVEREGLTFAPRNTDFKAQSIVAKTSLHGVGHDPFKDAPEFGSASAARGGRADTKRVYRTEDLVGKTANADRAAGQLPSGTRGSHGFTLDDGEDDVYEAGLGKEAYDVAVDTDDGDATRHDSLTDGAKAWASGAFGDEDELMLTSRRYARCPSDGRLPPVGFVVAQRRDASPRYWAPTKPPAGFKPVHTFDEDEITTCLNVRKSGLRPGTGIDASRRAKLLGEARSIRSSGRNVATLVALPAQSPSPLPADASVFSLMSPAARKQLLDATGGVGAPCPSLPNAVDESRAKGIGMGRFVGFTGGALVQEPADMSKDRPPGVLASKFTSEKLSTNDAGASATIQFGSVDPAVRPAGLTLRTPTSSHTSSTESRAATPSTQRQGSNPERNPVRTTVAWRPAPLLCKRLNVPVPSPSAGLDWARKAMAHGSQGASATSENPVLAPLNKFVPDSSVVRQIKVPLLQGMEQRYQGRTLDKSGAYGTGTSTGEESVVERPPIDLFKSIFESESGSESEASDSDGSNEHAMLSAIQVVDSSGAPPSRLNVATGNTEMSKRVKSYGSDSSDDSSGRVPNSHKLVPEGGASSAGLLLNRSKGGKHGDCGRERQGNKCRIVSAEIEIERDRGRKRNSSKSKHKRKEKSTKKERHRKHQKRKGSK